MKVYFYQILLEHASICLYQNPFVGQSPLVIIYLTMELFQFTADIEKHLLNLCIYLKLMVDNFEIVSNLRFSITFDLTIA